MIKKLVKLIFIDPKTKKKIFFFSLISVFSSILETLVIVSFIPVVSILLNANLEFSNNYIIKFLQSNLNFVNEDNYLLFLSVVSIIFLLLSFCFSIYSNIINYKISSDIGGAISSRLYNKFLNQEIIFFIKNNPTYLTKIITFDIPRILERVIQPFFRIFSKISLLFIITILLIAYDPFSTAIVFFLITFYYLFFNLIFKKKIFILSKNVSSFQSKLYANSLETFNFIREIILLKKLDFFSKIFEFNSINFYKNLTKILPIATIPRIVIEHLFFLIILLTMIIVIFSVKQEELSNILVSLFVYAICGIKIIPAFQGIYYEYASIKSGRESISAIENIDYFPKNFSKSNNKFTIKEFNNFIEFKDLTFFYQKKDKNIFNKINFKILKNETNLIIGKTGCGKSTLLDIICGFLKPIEGQILIDGKIYQVDCLSELSENISLIKQNFFGFNESILFNVTFMKNNFDIEKFNKAIEIAQLKEFMESKDEKENFNIGENGSKLSGGQKQRLAIARTLYNLKNILILDEATSALDYNTEKKILDDIVKNYKLTLIIVTHNKELISRANNIIDFERFNEKK